MEAEKSEVSPQRLRDYRIYRECLQTAFTNDGANNLDHKVTDDEQSILNTLATQLGLSQEEVKLIKYQILPVKKQAIDDVINERKTLGRRVHPQMTQISQIDPNALLIPPLLAGVRQPSWWYARKAFDRIQGIHLRHLRNLRTVIRSGASRSTNIDIVLNLGNNDLILVECKTVKESGYNKFSSVSRQLKAYVDLAKHNDLGW